MVHTSTFNHYIPGSATDCFLTKLTNVILRLFPLPFVLISTALLTAISAAFLVKYAVCFFFFLFALYTDLCFFLHKMVTNLFIDYVIILQRDANNNNNLCFSMKYIYKFTSAYF